jgi:hypothetical protein
MSDDSVAKQVGLTAVGGLLGAGAMYAGVAYDDSVKKDIPQFDEHACRAPIVKILQETTPHKKDPDNGTTSDKDTFAAFEELKKQKEFDDYKRDQAITKKADQILSGIKAEENSRQEQVQEVVDQNNAHLGKKVGAGAAVLLPTIFTVAGNWRKREDERDQVQQGQQYLTRG